MSLAIIIFPVMGILGFLAYLITPHEKSKECNKWFLIYVACLVALWIAFKNPFNEDLKILNFVLALGGIYGLLISGPGLLATISTKQDPLEKFLSISSKENLKSEKLNTNFLNIKSVIKCSKCQQQCRVPAKKLLEIKCPKCRHTWIQDT